MITNSHDCVEQCSHSPEQSVGSVCHEMDFVVGINVSCDPCVSAGMSSKESYFYEYSRRNISILH